MDECNDILEKSEKVLDKNKKSKNRFKKKQAELDKLIQQALDKFKSQQEQLESIQASSGRAFGLLSAVTTELEALTDQKDQELDNLIEQVKRIIDQRIEQQIDIEESEEAESSENTSE